MFNGLQLMFMVTSGLVFLMWAFTLFRTIFAIRQRTVAKVGKAVPGPMDTLRGWGDWLRDPDFRQERRQLLMMTITVFALSYLFSITLASAP